MLKYNDADSWQGEEGVRIFADSRSSETYVIELDTKHHCNQSYFINNTTNEVRWSGAGSRDQGDWEEVNTIDEFVQDLIDQGYEEVTDQLVVKEA